MLPQEQALVKLTSTNKENPRSTGPIYQVCMKHGPRHGYSRKQEAVTCAPCCCLVLMHERGGNPRIRKLQIKNGRGGTWNRNSINIEPDLIMSSLSFICSIRSNHQNYYFQNKRASTLFIWFIYNNCLYYERPYMLKISKLEGRTFTDSGTLTLSRSAFICSF